MWLLVRIAWRNLWRHGRRSLITATAMAVGVALCMAMLAFSDGMYAKMFDVLVEQQLGHVVVHHPDWPTKRAIYDTIPDADAELARLDALDGTEAATGRMIGYALIGGAEDSVGAQLMGVVPAREAAASPVDEKVIDGEWLADEPNASIVLGKGVAEDLRVKVGDEVVVVTQAADGSTGNALYTVRGIARSGNTMMDEGGAYLHLRDLQELLVLPDQVHEITLLSDDADAIGPYAERVRAAAPEGRLVRAWWEASPQTHQLLGMQDAAAFVMIGLVFSVAGLGVVNTMLMSVFERTRELGVLKAIGLRPWRMVAMVLLESVMLAGLSVAIGLSLGGLLDWWLVTRGIDFSATMKEGWTMAGITIDPVMRGHVRVEPIVTIVVAVFVTSVVAALWPAFRAARLRPVESIRAE